jgi:antitoxin component YwqK of YwqJK toxin-antitoxin module
MKNLTSILFSMLLVVACSKQVIITEDQLPEEKFYQSDNTTPYTGKCLVVYKGSDKIKEEMYFRDGVLNGTWTSYFESGKIERKGEFVDGLFNGKWEAWTESGQKIYEVYYKNDSLSGKYLTWYETGKIKEKGQYASNVKTGDWICYNESGEVVK